MGSTTQSIDVPAPIHAVYAQWTRFEEFPRFMKGVEEVRRDSPGLLFWKVNIGGKEKAWEAEITEHIPQQRISWQSVDGTPNQGEVTFESLDPDQTRVTLRMEYEPEGLLEMAGDALGFAAAQVEEDLIRFRDFITERVTEYANRSGSPDAAQISTTDNPQDHAWTSVRDESDIADGDSLRERETSQTGGKLAPASVAGERELADDWFAFGTPLTGMKATPPIPPVKVRLIQPTHEEIAFRAYQLYQARGGTPGGEKQDWLEAEKQLSQNRV
jgi:hypothetical protein